MDIRAYNRQAWDRKVAEKSLWTVPVDTMTIEAAREGEWRVILTPTKSVPREWFGDLADCDLLCLASGGGQQGPILAAAGARVTVFDNSPAQLAHDRLVAERDGLELRTIEGDMADLGAFAAESFDLIVHPVSNCFVSDLGPVWREAFRVLRSGGAILSGMMNPAYYCFDYELAEKGDVEIRHKLPYSDIADLDEATLEKHRQRGLPLEFSHSLTDQIAGQLEAGFLLAGFYEDDFGPDIEDPISDYMPTMMATRAVKPRQT
ncbi:MAG: class I SAM-dependent methyltransferase [Candidatus Krumholzibacteria bacterium]|nr:class I SAM-dependent methyltransferase [Candidatus Krumholzibacteria bacterium]